MNKIKAGFRTSDFVVMAAIILLIIGTAFSLGCDTGSEGDGDESLGDDDGIADAIDNCPMVDNYDQADYDGDGIGDACDNCKFMINIDQADYDSDGIGNKCDNCDGVPSICSTDLSGEWSLDVTQVTSSNGPEGDWDNNIEIVQIGCNLFITGIKDSVHFVDGCVSEGTAILGPGDFDDGGGKTTLTFYLDVAYDEQSMTGHESWRWVNESDPSDTYENGTAVVEVTRIP